MTYVYQIIIISPLLNRYNIVVFGGVDGYSRKVIIIITSGYTFQIQSILREQ